MYRKAITVAKYKMGDLLGDYAINHGKMLSEVEDYGNMLGLGLAMEFIGEESNNNYDASKDVHYCYPKNCWQMFKRDYLPRWITRLFPILYKHEKVRVDFKEYIYYPKFPDSKPDWAEGMKVKFSFQEWREQNKESECKHG